MNGDDDENWELRGKYPIYHSFYFFSFHEEMKKKIVECSTRKRIWEWKE